MEKKQVTDAVSGGFGVMVTSTSSGHSPSVPKQEKHRKRGGGRESSRGGGRVKVYLHAVTDEQAALLTDTANMRPLEEIKKSGADVEFDLNPPPVPGMKIVVIRGVPAQIEAAVRILNQETSSEKTVLEQAQTFWLQWVEAAFPDLDSRAYFLPPVYVNRVPMTRQSIANQDVLVLQSPSGQAGQSNQRVSSTSAAEAFSFHSSPYDSDIRDAAAKQRVLCCLQKLCEKNKEVLVVMTELTFGHYLGEPCYAAAASQLPLPASLPSALPRNWKQGDFDILLIHRHYGFVVCEVKTFGDNLQDLKMSQQDIDKNIRKKLCDAVSQLDKAEAMLSHLVSDIAPGLRITKTIVFPNLTASQVQQVISGDIPLTQDLSRCLGTSDPADITGLCLCCDQLSDPKTPWDVSSHVLRELGHWWQRRVAVAVAVAGPHTQMTPELYKTLVARFCGPATTVTVPSISPPRVSVKTLGQAVWWTGECYTAVITLFPEQLHLLHTAPPTLFVTGPPGTGKTVMLLLMAIQWLRCGHPVYIVSTCDESRAACMMLYHLLMQTVKTQQSAGVSPCQPHLLQCHLDGGEDVEKAVNDLSQAASGGSLYVIADEVGPERKPQYFKDLCKKLLTQVPHLHIWAASCFRGHAPAGWQVEYLTRPLRSPPAVVREIEQDGLISRHRYVQPYSERRVPDHTDGPPVTRLYHRGPGHSGVGPGDCVTCGREIASLLHSLRVGVAESGATSTSVTSISGGAIPPCLQWRDMLVLSWDDVSDDAGMVKRLEEAGIPVRVMKDDDIEDVATSRSDVVWVARGDCVRGLERKVIVCLVDLDLVRLHFMSRCTSQLVIVS